MAAIDFPASPTDGQLFTAGNNVTYQWSAAKGLWFAAGTIGLVAPSIYDRLTTAQPADPGGYTTYTVPMTITQGSQVPWPGGPGAIKTFTAKTAANPIEVDVTLIHGAGAANNGAVAGLFIDGATNAVQQSYVSMFAQGLAQSRLLWRGVLSAGAHTYQVRWVGGTASYLLRNDTAIFTGSNTACTIAIREVAD